MLFWWNRENKEGQNVSVVFVQWFSFNAPQDEEYCSSKTYSILKYLCPQGFPLIWRNSSPALNHGCTLPLLPSPRILKIIFKRAPHVNLDSSGPQQWGGTFPYWERKGISVGVVCSRLCTLKHNIISAAHVLCKVKHQTTEKPLNTGGPVVSKLSTSPALNVCGCGRDVGGYRLIRACCVSALCYPEDLKKMKTVYTLNRLKQPWSIHSQSPGTHA